MSEARARPLRPGMPILVPAALAMWAAAAASYLGLEDASLALMRAWCAAGCVGAMAGIAGMLCRRVRKPCLVACFCCLGLAVGSAGAHGFAAAAGSLPPGEQSWTLTLLSDPKRSQFGSTAEAFAESRDAGSFRVKAYFDEDAGLLCGARLSVTCALKALKESEREYCYGSGIVGTVAASEFASLGAPLPFGIILGLRERAIALIGAYGCDHAGVMQALVCGYRNTIQESGEYELFKRCGLAHIVAVSGAHLAIVTLALGWALKRARLPRWLCFGTSVGFVLAYLVFAGIPISAVRAAIMVVLAMSAGIAKRRSASLNAIALCIMAFLAADPVSAVSVSLFLSAASTLGIVLFAPLASSWLSGLPRLLHAPIAEPLSLTLSANLATMPFSVALFKQLPLVAPVANVIAAPLFTVGCVGGLVAALLSCAIEPIAPFAIAAGGALSFPLRAATAALAHVPFGCIALDAPLVPMIALSTASALLLWLTWPALKLRHLAAAAGVVCVAAFAAIALPSAWRGTELVMLDVGQGDALLLRSGSAAVLVDTGNRDAALREELAKQGVFRLDAVVVTHPDDDHCASLSSLFGYVQVDRVLCAADLLACPCEKCEQLVRAARDGVGEDGIVGLACGDTLAVGAMAMEVIWPHAFSDAGGNADSLCLMVSVDLDADGVAEWKALLTGDAERDELQAMAKRGALGDIDVLKVGHHGSKAALDAEMASLLHPEVALVSVGATNRYGHPSDEALGFLETIGAKVLRTDEHGTVALSFANDGLRVQ